MNFCGAQDHTYGGDPVASRFKVFDAEGPVDTDGVTSFEVTENVGTKVGVHSHRKTADWGAYVKLNELYGVFGAIVDSDG